MKSTLLVILCFAIFAFALAEDEAQPQVEPPKNTCDLKETLDGHCGKSAVCIN